MNRVVDKVKNDLVELRWITFDGRNIPVVFDNFNNMRFAVAFELTSKDNERIFDAFMNINMLRLRLI